MQCLKRLIIGFTLLDLSDFTKKIIDFGKRGELDYYICESVNNGLGSPISIPNGIFETLIDKLRSQTLQKK